MELLKKLFKAWAYEVNTVSDEIIILIQYQSGSWRSIATISDCPTEGMTPDEIDNTYNDLLTNVIDELGWKSVWV